MPFREEKWTLHQKWGGTFALYVLIFVGLSSCNQINIPRLSFEEEPQPRIPISVNYQFDQQLTQATLQVEACGLPYTISSGALISQEFVKIGRERFANVQVVPGGGPSINGTATNSVIIELQLLQHSFTPEDQSGDQDRFLAEVSLQLLAIYKDPQGNPIAQTPLTYLDKSQIWAPNLSNQSSSCATGQFDAEIQEAAEILAKTMADDMAKALPQLFGQAPTAGTTAQGQPIPQGQGIPAFRQPPTLTFRTMLKDGNDNLILEGGEKLVLQVETLNTGTVPIASAQIELDGSPEILQAFTKVTTFPIEIGVIQPGQTTTTEIRGIMPDINQEARGKLIVSVIDANGRSIGSHNILAAIQPGPSTATRSHKKRPRGKAPGGQYNSKITPTPSDSSPYYAIIIGLDSYRDPWRHMPKKNTTNANALVDALLITGSFPQQHIRILRNDHATKTDIEEVLFSWATPQLQEDSILLVYFAGQAIAKPQNGEVYLVPYEGTPRRSTKGLISLRVLQKYLSQLPNKTTLLFLNTPITVLNQGNTKGPHRVNPRIKWASGISTPSSSSPGKLIQLREREGL
ncbi:MAG: hypothetical protein O7F12_12655, partial [Nitrospirae bacterium]|nr:hypothetical protein [Nitrospirota bacterium]